MKMQLRDFIPLTLAERGTMSWEALLLHCADWTSEKFVRSTLRQLVTDGAVETVDIKGVLFYKLGQQQTEQARAAAASDELQDSIVAELERRPMSGELLRDVLCVASQVRFARAIQSLQRSRRIVGTWQQFRLPAQARTKSYSSLDAIYRDRREQVSA